MLGVYDYTVILTYISLMVSIGGMLFSLNGDCRMALVCLAISGLCDMFDGKVARTKKDRTEVEKRFGIQIDSLADIVCFGVSPAILCYRMGMRGLTGVAILLFYVLAGLIRLAWFNVSEEVRQDETEENVNIIRDFRSHLWLCFCHFWQYLSRCLASGNLCSAFMRWYCWSVCCLLQISNSVNQRTAHWRSSFAL